MKWDNKRNDIKVSIIQNSNEVKQCIRKKNNIDDKNDDYK